MNVYELKNDIDERLERMDGMVEEGDKILSEIYEREQAMDAITGDDDD